ncbi:MAG: Trm112 family protein [Candidatus Malihini olakiniferum]
MDHRLLEIVACPVCKGQLYYNKDKLELICKVDSLSYPVRDGIPVLLENEARKIPSDGILE